MTTFATPRPCNKHQQPHPGEDDRRRVKIQSTSRQVGQCLSQPESSLRRAVHFSNQSHSTCATMTTSRDQGFYGNQKYGIDMDTKWIQMAERSERCNAATKVYTDIYSIYIYDCQLLFERRTSQHRKNENRPLCCNDCSEQSSGKIRGERIG